MDFCSLRGLDRSIFRSLRSGLSECAGLRAALPIPPSAHATLWQPVYTTSVRQTRPDLLEPGAPETPKDHAPMQQPLSTGVPTLTTPSFYITGRQPLRPGAILLAIV